MITAQCSSWLQDIAVKNKGGVPSSEKISNYMNVSLDVARSWREEFINDNRPLLEKLRGGKEEEIEKPFQPINVSPPVFSIFKPEEEKPEEEKPEEEKPEEEKPEEEKPEEEKPEALKTRFKIGNFNLIEILHIHTYLNAETIRWGFGALAGFLAVRDFNYYHHFFSKFDPSSAWITAIIGVSALLMLPVAIIEKGKLLKLSPKKHIAGLLFLILSYVPVLSFTAYITYESVMTSRQEVVVAKNSGNQEDIKGNESLKRKKDRETELVGYIKQADEVINRTSGIKNPDLLPDSEKNTPSYKASIAQYWADLRDGRNARIDRDKYDLELKAVRSSIEDIQKTTNVAIKFDDDNIDDLDKFMVTMWAVFLDILGPVSVYISFFL